MPTRLDIDGLANARELGGLERRDGSRTPTGVFIRAETLDRVSNAGWDRLRAHGVRTVIDLRRPEETSGEVPADIVRHQVDLDGDERDFWASRESDGQWGTPLYYADHLAELPHRLAGVLDAIAQAPDGAVLFHCGAGWDRTGLVAAVLLKAVGATEDAAAGDYLASFDNAPTMVDLHARSFEVDERRAVLARFGHTPESAFRAMWRGLDLDPWLRTHLDARAVEVVTTWRGTVAPAPDLSSVDR